MKSKKSTIKAVRMSGRPVSLEQFEAYDAEFKERFDVIQAEVGPDMLTFQKKLMELDEELKPKYSVVEQWPFPSNQKELDKLIVEYGMPIMFAKSAEAGNELLLILMDEQI